MVRPELVKVCRMGGLWRSLDLGGMGFRLAAE